MELPCENCLTGYVLPGEPKGSFKGSAYYVSGMPENSTESATVGGNEKKAIVLLTDSFGLALKNPKILADDFAKRFKCEVFVPDLFNGRPSISETALAPYIPDVPGQKFSIINRVKWIIEMIKCLPALWVNRPAVGLRRAEHFIRNLKKEGYSHIGIVGYCYGGGISLGLSTRPDLANAVVACHPGPVNIADLTRTVTPLIMLCSEDDEWLPPAKRDNAEAALKRNKAAPSKVITYKGTVHGFAARPALGIPSVKEGFEGAFKEACSWFEKYL